MIIDEFLKSAIKKMKWNNENIIMITIKHLEINLISILNKP